MKNKLLYLSILSFLLVSTTAISHSSKKSSNLESLPIVRASEKIYPKLPVSNGTYQFPVLSAQSVKAIDVESGITLYEKDPQKVLLPASTTKIITALVAMDIYHKGQVLEVKNESKITGQKMGLFWGEKISFDALLEGLLIYSANDAAEVFANNHPEGREKFIELMNKKAADLGMKDSNFVNPTGLDHPNHYTTARDLAVVTKYALKDTDFARIVAINQTVVTSYDGLVKHRLSNINKLLGEVEGVYGVKTGWTENARENLITYVNRDGKKIIIVLLGSSDRFGETKEIIKWIFDNYTWNEVKPNIFYWP